MLRKTPLNKSNPKKLILERLANNSNAPKMPKREHDKNDNGLSSGKTPLTKLTCPTSGGAVIKNRQRSTTDGVNRMNNGLPHLIFANTSKTGHQTCRRKRPLKWDRFLKIRQIRICVESELCRKTILL